MYRRFLDLPTLAAARSFFLLGPRQTGKSTLLRASFPDALFLDLLDAQRSLLNFRVEYYQFLADYEQRSAELERVVGKEL